MAYHAGTELSGIECHQITPLIKDYNGPACAYVANLFSGYQVNNRGERFMDCDYWSGQMMAEVVREIASARGAIYLKPTHLPDETLTALESMPDTTERSSGVLKTRSELRPPASRRPWCGQCRRGARRSQQGTARTGRGAYRGCRAESPLRAMLNSSDPESAPRWWTCCGC
jgi:succinate dehydrogenase/fumarate reductase flavoprotein subunit